MSAAQKKGLVSVFSAALVGGAVVFGVPLDVATAVVSGLTGLLLGKVWLKQPG